MQQARPDAHDARQRGPAAEHRCATHPAEHPLLAWRRRVRLQQVFTRQEGEGAGRHRDVGGEGPALRPAALRAMADLDGCQRPRDAEADAFAEAVAVV